MQDSEPKDVVLVAHGHLTRAFAKRWLGYELSFPLSLMMEPGGVGVLSYQHHNINEPALLLGLGFPSQEYANTVGRIVRISRTLRPGSSLARQRRCHCVQM